LQGWLLLAVTAAFELCCEYSRAMIRPWSYMAMQLVRSAGMVGFGVLFVLLGARWHGPLLGLTIGMGLASAYSYWNDWRNVRLRIDRVLLARICSYGLPLSLTLGLGVLISASDRFLIAAMLGESAAGLYSVAVDLTNQTLMLIMMAVYLAVFPHAVRAWEEGGPAAAAVHMRSNILLLLGLVAPCVVGMMVLAPGISHCVLGSSYRQAAIHVIPLVAVGTFLSGLKACHFDAALQFPHRTIHQVWIALVAAVVNVVINLFAIRFAGINGAAAGSALTYVVAILVTILWGRRYVVLPFPPLPVAQVAFAACIMALALYPLRERVSLIDLIIQITCGAAIYGLALLSCNFLGSRRLLQQKWRARLSTPEDAMEFEGSDS
jgi:O-antigen/teichoic acid export membrane protein